MTEHTHRRDATSNDDGAAPTPKPDLPALSDAVGTHSLSAALPAAGIAQITKAIAAVMSEINTVAKRGRHAFHRYHYARMEDVLRQLTPLLGKHGLVVFQDEVSRSMFDNDGVIAVTYEFAVAHESGEIWPQRLRQTGVARCRDSKGGWDDKAINKCHTGARKYFLLSLFQIPTGEEVDADRGDNDTIDSEEPQAIRVDKGGAKAWTTQFLARIRQAPTLAAVEQWAEENQANLERLAQIAPEQWKITDAALDRRRGELTPNAKSLPPLVGARANPPKGER